jgi:5-(carboxyamino)imidazole ribonucleotide mutase
MKKKPLISVIMGSKSDWPTMKHATAILEDFKIPHEVKIVSAHRTPKRMGSFANSAEKRGIKIIISGAGGAAHLPGMTASQTNIPVLGVPIKSKQLDGIDSILSIAQMPKGIPVGTLAIGEAGAANAALLAISILGLSNKAINAKYSKWRINQTKRVSLKP